MKKILIAVVCISLAVALIYFFTRGNDTKSVTVVVSKVVDGDTIEMSNGDIVRLIGIDAPEKSQPFFKEVNEELGKLVGKPVILERDESHMDSYNRLLRYVYLGDHFINIEMVRNGLASAYIVHPDDKYEKEFLEAERYARENEIGIWEKSEFASCISVENFRFNAKGNDNDNLNDEYVVFSNLCDTDLSMVGWSLNDLHGNRYIFKEFSLKPHTSVTVFSGAGNSSHEKLFWNSRFPIWNNDEDAITLRDAAGKIATYKSYNYV